MAHTMDPLALHGKNMRLELVPVSRPLVVRATWALVVLLATGSSRTGGEEEVVVVDPGSFPAGATLLQQQFQNLLVAGEGRGLAQVAVQAGLLWEMELVITDLHRPWNGGKALTRHPRTMVCGVAQDLGLPPPLPVPREVMRGRLLIRTLQLLL